MIFLLLKKRNVENKNGIESLMHFMWISVFILYKDRPNNGHIF